MSESNTQRNLAVTAAVVAAIGFAGVVGYFAGRGGSDAPAAPRVGAEIATAAATEAPLAVAAGPERAPAELPSVAARERSEPPAATAPRAGARRPQTSTPEPTPAPVAAAEPLAGASEEPAMAPEAVVAAAPAPVAPVPVEIPAGTMIQLALEAPVSSQIAAVGDRVEANLAAPIRLDGEIVVPSGTRVVGRVTEVKALAKVGGQARLALAFERLEVEPESTPIAAFWAAEGKSETGKDAATIAAGAAIGTILGNQAKKNDRGKVIGAVVGAGVGTAVAAGTKGETIELAAGATLELTLREPVRVLPPR